jgi:hypothetical protein
VIWRFQNLGRILAHLPYFSIFHATTQKPQPKNARWCRLCIHSYRSKL